VSLDHDDDDNAAAAAAAVAMTTTTTTQIEFRPTVVSIATYRWRQRYRSERSAELAFQYGTDMIA